MFSKDEIRFWSKVESSIDGCWEWQAHLDDWGYGTFTYGGKIRKAHRVCFAWYCGEIPQGMVICHSCDNPKCVNPNHLWLGTNHDNVLDRERKGRGFMPYHAGDSHYSAKYTQSDFDLVFKLRAEGKTQKEISVITGMKQQTISRILLGKQRVVPKKDKISIPKWLADEIRAQFLANNQ